MNIQIVFGVFALVSGYIASIYLQFHKNGVIIWNQLKRGKIAGFLIFCVLYIVYAKIIIILSDKGLYSYLDACSYLTLIYCLQVLALIDIKKRIVPNIILLIMIGLRFIYLLIDIAFFTEISGATFYEPLVGFLLGMGILGIASVVSKKGIGAGDIKLFAIVGLFVSWAGVLEVLFLTSLFAAVTVGLGLLFKIVTLKDSIPLVPFIMLGTIAYFVMMFFV